MRVLRRPRGDRDASGDALTHKLGQRSGTVSDTITIAIDAMGGDGAPGIVLKGAEIALQRHPAVRYLLFGAEEKIRPLIDKLPRLSGMVTVFHTAEVVADDAKPSLALRTGRQSSMRLAIDAVADGRADGVVSAGNTGALMAMAKFALKMLPGIDRPAIASFFPTQHGESVMLDLGANIECDAENLVQFALMGDVFARTVLGLIEPTVGLLNVGSEDLKGNNAVRAAGARLRLANTPIQFHGFVEGDDIAAGTVDVVVTDGFTGNVAVKSHGSTDAFGFANAIGVAIDMKVNGFLDKIRAELERLNDARSVPQPAAL